MPIYILHEWITLTLNGFYCLVYRLNILYVAIYSTIPNFIYPKK
jgi:hypothetical protein